MKIAMPVVDNGNSKLRLATSFHNTRYVCIYGCADQTYEWTTAQSISQNAGDLGKALKLQGIGAIISKQMPPMALGFFVESGLPVFQAKSEDLAENIRLFNNNQLQLLTAESAKSASGCAGSCGSCSTTCKS
jgi:predicted Fe-Mo cluster-binding NifX family protein